MILEWRLEFGQPSTGNQHLRNMSQFFPSLPYIERSAKRVRVFVKGVCVVDSKRAKLVYVDVPVLS